MKKITLLFLTGIFSIITLAQNNPSNISIAIDEKAYKENDQPKYLKNDLNQLYYYSIKQGKSISIFHYSKDFSIISQKEIVLPKRFIGRYILELNIKDSKIEVLSGHSIKKNTKYYFETFDLKKGGSNEDEKFIVEKKDWRPGGKIAYSPDGSKMILYNVNSRKKVDTVMVLVFDSNYSIMNKQSKFAIKSYDYSEFVSTKKWYQIIHNAIKVDNNGNLYFMMRVYNKEDIKTSAHEAIVNRIPLVEYEKDEQFYSYILYRAAKDNNYQIEILSIKGTNGNFIKDAFLSILGGDTLLISGNYSKKNNLNSEGAFSCTPDYKNDIILVKNYFPYSRDFITQYCTAWEISKINQAFQNKKVWDYFDYRAVGCERYKNGHIVFIESTFDFRISYNMGQQSNASVRQHLNLTAIIIHKDGTISDVIKIQKRQEQVESNKASLYIYSSQKNRIHIAYNKPLINKATSSNSIHIMTLDAHKKITEKSIYTRKDHKGFITFKNQNLDPNIILCNYQKTLTKKKYNNLLIKF